MKRLNEIKRGADISTGPTHGEAERPAPHSTTANVGSYLLKQTVDSNRAPSQTSPSFKEEVCV